MTVYEDVFAPMRDSWVSRARSEDADDEQFYLEEVSHNVREGSLIQ
jgi:hypothetical protein